ncbi:hypothetical protein MKY41_01620 [Sporosarcina sp. FSL W7-1349]|uniref:hypothetical protein n=1 Tax=Sporosarcina sp. FSL W7-1349 TaxID=2921561 RepID=UPI0030FA7A71
MIYNALKIVINGGNYDYEATLTKMDFYLLGDRIDIKQYDELKSVMDAQKVPSE